MKVYSNVFRPYNDSESNLEIGQCVTTSTSQESNQALLVPFIAGEVHIAVYKANRHASPGIGGISPD